MGQIYTLMQPQKSGSKAATQPLKSARVGEAVEPSYEVDLSGLSDAQRDLLEQARQMLGVATLGEAMAILCAEQCERMEAGMKKSYKSMVGLWPIEGGKP